MTTRKQTSVSSPAVGDRSYLKLLVLLNIASQGLLGLLAPLTKEFAADLDASLADIAHIQLVFLIAYAAATPVWALLASKFSRHSILVLVSVLWGTCCGLVSMTDDVLLFTIGFAIAAIGNAAVVPVSFSMAVDVVPADKRGHAFGWLSTAHTLSMGLAFLTGGLLAERSGWRLPFQVFAAFGAISAVLLLTWKRYEPKHGAMEGELQGVFADGKDYTYRIRPADLRFLFRPIANMWLVLATLLNTIPIGAVGFWFIGMLRNDHQFDAADATVLLLVLYMIQIPGAIFVGKLADRVSKKWSNGKLLLLLWHMLLTLPCYGIGFLVVWKTASFTSPAFLLFLGCVLTGAFLACGLPPLTYNAVGDINSPEKRSVMFAMISIARILGRGVGIQLVTMISAASLGQAISPGIGWTALALIPAALCVLPVIRSAADDRAALSRQLRGQADTLEGECAA